MSSSTSRTAYYRSGNQPNQTILSGNYSYEAIYQSTTLIGSYSYSVMHPSTTLSGSYSYNATRHSRILSVSYSFTAEPLFTGARVYFKEDNDYLIPYVDYIKDNQSISSNHFGYPVQFDFRLAKAIPQYKIRKEFLRKVIYAIETENFDIFDGESKRVVKALFRLYNHDSLTIDDGLNEYGEPMSDKDKYLLNNTPIPFGSTLPDDMLKNNTYSLTPEDYSRVALLDYALTWLLTKEPIEDRLQLN